jgi:hypothetical protein
MRFRLRRTVLFVCLQVALTSPAFAQNWSFDARTVGLGGVGSTSNVAVDMVDEQRPYRPIVLPFGLLQVLPNLPKLDPTSDDFDLVRAIEYTVSPIHYVIGRDDTDTASLFITDLRNGTLNRDLRKGVRDRHGSRSHIINRWEVGFGVNGIANTLLMPAREPAFRARVNVSAGSVNCRF